jgi:hypothetical protein
MACLLAMTKLLGGVCLIVVGKHYIVLQAAFYVFTIVTPLQHISPRTNSKLQPRVVVKYSSMALGAP